MKPSIACRLPGLQPVPHTSRPEPVFPPTLVRYRSVVSNASIWDTMRLLPEGSVPREFVEKQEAYPQCKSFMHVHLGIRCHDLIESKAPSPGDTGENGFRPRCHYAVVGDWNKPIDAPGNVIVVSIPSVLDPSLAPPGCHAVHAYT